MSRLLSFYNFLLASYEKKSSHLQLLRSVVGLDSLRHYRARGVSVLEVLTLRRDRPCHVARTQSEGRSQRRQRRYQHRDDNLKDLLPGHTLKLLNF